MDRKCLVSCSAPSSQEQSPCLGGVASHCSRAACELCVGRVLNTAVSEQVGERSVL